LWCAICGRAWLLVVLFDEVEKVYLDIFNLFL